MKLEHIVHVDVGPLVVIDQRAIDELEQEIVQLSLRVAALEKALSKPEASSLNLSAGPVADLPGGIGPMPIKQEIKDHQHFALSVAPKDAAGNPAQVQGSPTYTVDDPTGLTLGVPAADGSCDVASTGKIGVFVVTASADADLGDGVTTITDTCEVTVVSGQATQLGLAAGVPAELP